MDKYYQAPYDKVIDFLKTEVSEENLKALYDYYNVSFGNIEQLADIVSDGDLQDLGFNFYTEPAKENYDPYKYGNVEDIAIYLSTLDSDEIEHLQQQYYCNDLVDLAIALTDDELCSLGYSEDCGDNYNDDLRHSDNNYEYFSANDYNEALDYLEDLPYDLQFMYLGKDENNSDLFITDSEESFERFKNSLDSSLIRSCEAIGTEDVFEPTGPESMLSYAFSVNPTMSWEQQVSEEVIINNKLNPAIFDDEHKVLPEVKEQIIDYVQGFINKMNEKGVDIDYSDICIIGSNAGYLYTPESDIDVHMISSKQIDLDIAERLFDEFDIYEDENPLIINNSKVELGIEDNYDIIMDNKNARRYSLLTDEWVNNSDEFENFKPEDIETINGYEDIVDDYTKRINDVVDADNYEQAELLKQEIRKNRSDDLANIGALSMGNVVFKELRNNGAFGKLRNYLVSKEIVGEMD